VHRGIEAEVASRGAAYAIRFHETDHQERQAMRPVAPRTGGEEITYGGGDVFSAMTIALHPVEDTDALISQVTRWTFTAEERARVAAGEDVYFSLLREPGPITPVAASVGWPS
jgi:hypothetical protein